MTDAHASTPPSATEFARLLRRQHALYVQLRDLSEQQRSSLEEGSTQDLLTVLSQRQSVVDDLSETASALAANGGQWNQYLGELPDRERDELRELVADVQRLAEEVMQRDEHDQSQLRSMRQRVGGELRGLHAGHAAANAYRGGAAGTQAPPPRTPRFADRSA
jgi:flagellar biosynthesis/type III secretory pathway chaperone